MNDIRIRHKSTPIHCKIDARKNEARMEHKTLNIVQISKMHTKPINNPFKNNPQIDVEKWAYKHRYHPNLGGPRAEKGPKTTARVEDSVDGRDPREG